jgi:hypothetical protein
MMLSISRTLRVIFAIARGHYILSEDYVYDSLCQGAWVQCTVASPHRITRYRHLPIMNALSPDHHSSNGSENLPWQLLKGKHIVLLHSTTPSVTVLSDLIRIAGGHILDTEKALLGDSDKISFLLVGERSDLYHWLQIRRRQKQANASAMISKVYSLVSTGTQIATNKFLFNCFEERQLRYALKKQAESLSMRDLSEIDDEVKVELKFGSVSASQGSQRQRGSSLGNHPSEEDGEEAHDHCQEQDHDNDADNEEVGNYNTEEALAVPSSTHKLSKESSKYERSSSKASLKDMEQKTRNGLTSNNSSRNKKEEVAQKTDGALSKPIAIASKRGRKRKVSLISEENGATNTDDVDHVDHAAMMSPMVGPIMPLISLPEVGTDIGRDLDRDSDDDVNRDPLVHYRKTPIKQTAQVNNRNHNSNINQTVTNHPLINGGEKSVLDELEEYTSQPQQSLLYTQAASPPSPIHVASTGGEFSDKIERDNLIQDTLVSSASSAVNTNNKPSRHTTALATQTATNTPAASEAVQSNGRKLLSSAASVLHSLFSSVAGTVTSTAPGTATGNGTIVGTAPNTISTIVTSDSRLHTEVKSTSASCTATQIASGSHGATHTETDSARHVDRTLGTQQAVSSLLLLSTKSNDDSPQHPRHDRNALNSTAMQLDDYDLLVSSPVAFSPPAERQPKRNVNSNINSKINSNTATAEQRGRRRLKKKLF